MSRISKGFSLLELLLVLFLFTLLMPTLSQLFYTTLGTFVKQVHIQNESSELLFLRSILAEDFDTARAIHLLNASSFVLYFDTFEVTYTLSSSGFFYRQVSLQPKQLLCQFLTFSSFQYKRSLFTLYPKNPSLPPISLPVFL